jgi:hypothetical protein
VVAAQASRHAIPLAVDVVSEHMDPGAEQALLVQQSWFAPPQAAQVPLEQTVSVAVQVLPVQQGCPAWPHKTSQTWPALQDSPVMQTPHSTVLEHLSITFPQRLPGPWPQKFGTTLHAASARSLPLLQ